MDLQTVTTRKDLSLPAGLFISLIIYGGYRVWARRSASRARAATPLVLSNHSTSEMSALAKAKERGPGEWHAVKFDYPRVASSATHFSTLKPIPYRPFRWGDYHVTMGIRNMLWDEWIELDRDFAQTHRVCDYRMQTRGEKLVQMHPAQPGVVESGHAAAEEFLYELAEYLSRRHPDVYRVTRHPVSAREDENGWYGEGRIKTITIVPFQETHNLDMEEPLKAARSLIQEDFTIMLEGSDGRYYLQAGAVCIAGSWRLEDKMGMPLEEIHTSGHVPKYKDKLQMSMERYFRRMPVDKPIVRNNYAFQVVAQPEMRRPAPPAGSLLDVDPGELAWAVTMNGDEETSEYERAKHINDQYGEDAYPVSLPYRLEKVETPATAETLHLRTERQTLRRLPRTGAIVFTIRVYQTQLAELVKEPGVPGRIASAIRSWPEDVARYKARGAYESILPYLDKCHAEQVERGITSEEDKKTNFPF
ncbi:hypothetical protein GSI_00351 [Ganoderma sinense ZZ0214-1]|uniref:Uncharacterized protein n=1 Tax=Ganoderma sinense ZZ0214-1 TaxID=1077348 RepID=A0A2G8SSE4_9APHY|nr:hypothetical protein GSI_00351 [Ganoderma sinense ZZ0214-1]